MTTFTAKNSDSAFVTPGDKVTEYASAMLLVLMYGLSWMAWLSLIG